MFDAPQTGVVRAWILAVAIATMAGVLEGRAAAESPLKARTTELPSDDSYPYTPVNLNPVANDPGAVQFPDDRISYQGGIPFDVARKGAANSLYLKSIGWTDHQAGGYVVAEYDNGDVAVNDPERAMVRIPVADYKSIWLLAATDDDTKLSDVLTMRIGVANGQGPALWTNVTVHIPRANAANPYTTGAEVAGVIPTATGKLYLIHVPFARAMAEDFKAYRTFWLDFTKELRTAINLPDPFRFDVRPIGVASGVRVYAATLELATLQIAMTPVEGGEGNVFNEPQTPAFDLELTNVLAQHYVPYDIQTEATSDDGTVVRQTFHEAFRTWNWRTGNDPVIHYTFKVPVPKRGLYNLKVTLLERGKEVVNTRETTFALLAPDTRQHRDQSPFGTWDFAGGHGGTSDWRLRGPLYVKAGLRCVGLHDGPVSMFAKYGLAAGNDVEASTLFSGGVKGVQNELKSDPELAQPTRFLIFHEHGVSGANMTRTPDLFTGKNYKFSPEEEKTFQHLWAQASKAIPEVRAAYPNAEIYFGNTTPHLLEEFLRHGWPVKDLPYIGNESGSFMHPPEAQPTDFIANNSCLWMLRQIADHYGAKDVPLRQCVEIGYPGSNQGNLTETTQAAYMVRNNMHSMAWHIPIIRPMLLMDVSGSYYHSQWGSAGLCHSWPNASPKPAYVAFAVQTLLLDGAAFNRYVPTGSTAVYAAEFRKQDKSCVTVFWTLRGTRPVTVQVHGSGPVVHTNMMGRETEVEVKKHLGVIEITDRPSYLSTRHPLDGMTLGEPVYDNSTGEKSVLISALDKLDDWSVQSGHDAELETYDFMNPRRPGNFEFNQVKDSDGNGSLEVYPKLPVEGSHYLQMFSSLVLKKPAEIPGEPTQIGVMVNGNGGWGRVIFELEDAAGQRWISIGAEQAGEPNPWMADWLSKEDFAKLNPKSMNVCDWNSDDAWGRSYINFDGWRLVKFPMPGQYAGDGYHWPMNSQWRWSGDGVVHYPLKFKRLVVTMPEKVLYGTQYIAPQHYNIAVKNLVAMYAPLDKVFGGE